MNAHFGVFASLEALREIWNGLGGSANVASISHTRLDWVDYREFKWSRWWWIRCKWRRWRE